MSKNRPLLHQQIDMRKRFIELIKNREHLYRETADLVYNTDGYTVPRLAKKIMHDIKKFGF